MVLGRGSADFVLLLFSIIHNIHYMFRSFSCPSSINSHYSSQFPSTQRRSAGATHLENPSCGPVELVRGCSGQLLIICAFVKMIQCSLVVSILLLLSSVSNLPHQSPSGVRPNGFALNCFWASLLKYSKTPYC